MNLEKSISEAVTTAVREIRQESCIEKQVKKKSNENIRRHSCQRQ